MAANQTFGKILKRLRTQQGWTLRKMAQEANSNFAYLSQLEADLAKPSEELVGRIADAFQLKGNDREHLIFVARGIPEQIKGITDKYPNVAPGYLRRALRKEKE